MHDKRPFSSVLDMDTYMISAWNNRVTSQDEVYILGDLAFGTAQDLSALLSVLKGKLYLVRGNHDRHFESRFELITDYLEVVDNKWKLVCSHYPMICYNGQFRGAYMLFGHIHRNKENLFLRSTANAMRADGIPCNMINCFCGFSGFVPLTLDEWLHVSDAVI